MPYVTAGIGGTTVTRSSSDVDTSDLIIDQGNLTILERDQIRNIVDDRIDDAREILPSPINEGSYFTFNYGGGFKGYRLWGPVGLRADFLGRNLPNFAGKALNAFQLTGGITVAWGER